MQNLSKIEQEYLQAHEGGIHEGESSGLTLDMLNNFHQYVRGKLMKVYGEALTESSIAGTVSSEELKEAMNWMSDSLHDTLGNCPLVEVAQRNEGITLRSTAHFNNSMGSAIPASYKSAGDTIGAFLNAVTGTQDMTLDKLQRINEEGVI